MFYSLAKMLKYVILVCLLGAGAGAAVVPNGTPKINPILSWKIVGGSDAPDGEYPYQVSLRVLGSHVCGGSIVTKNYVITAAHCVYEESPSSVTVVAGSNQLSSGGDTYIVEEIHWHEDYNMYTPYNDVAVLKLGGINFTDKVGPIIAETEDVGGDEPVILSGWGTTSYPGTIPNNLQHLNLKTTTLEYCKGRHFIPIIENQICTFTKVGEGACNGDSGGPLIRTVDGIRRLVGLVSWGRPCGVGYPDVYSRVASFRDWFNGKCNYCLN